MSLNLLVFASAGGLRNWNAPAFSTLKKFASHFFNPQLRWVPQKKRRLTQLLVRVKKYSVGLILINTPL
jgi:hypothetical protein